MTSRAFFTLPKEIFRCRNVPPCKIIYSKSYLYGDMAFWWVMKCVRYNLYNYVCFRCHLSVAHCYCVVSLSSYSTVGNSFSSPTKAYENVFDVAVDVDVVVVFSSVHWIHIVQFLNRDDYGFLEHFFCLNHSVNNVVVLTVNAQIVAKNACVSTKQNEGEGKISVRNRSSVKRIY